MRVSFQQFPGAVLVIVPVPQLFAMFYSVHFRHCSHYPTLPDGQVPFGVYCDFGHPDSVEEAQMIYEQRKEQIIGATRRLIFDGQCRN